MIKKIMVLLLFSFLSLYSDNGYKKLKLGVKNLKVNENASRDQSKGIFTGMQGSTFDKSGNGFGWHPGASRKIQVYNDPMNGPTLGSIYRKLDTDTGVGTIGGVVGKWDTDYTGYAQAIYSESPYQGVSGTEVDDPGGRYPFTSEFINGYVFGIFNDYAPALDAKVNGTISQPMFVVGDASFGWDLSYWPVVKRIEATKNGSVIPGAWTGVGDVAYNPEDGYYYWTTAWAMNGLVDGFNDMKVPFVTGRSNNPIDPDSWEWTDYSELLMDCTDRENGFLNFYGDMQIAYAKDTEGNGTGFAVAVTPYVDVTYVKTNLAGDTLDVSSHERLGYIYTTNWGADWSSGEFDPNWETPNGEGNNFLPADTDKLFDWYNTIVSDSIGIDSLSGATIYDEIPLNWMNILANADVVCTENNIVHVLTKVIGGSTEAPDYWFYTNDEKTVAGYYDIVGEITETGINWIRASYIASWMGWEDNTDEMLYSNWNRLSIGYAGNGVVYASWWDRPESRYVVTPAEWTSPASVYIDDVYFTYSPDDGRTWDINKINSLENPMNPESPFELKYASNITNTSALMEEGFSVSTHGSNIGGQDGNGTMTVYAACQYYDPSASIEDPIRSYYSYEQFLKVWQITGSPTGIETQDVLLDMDFELMQNYPNPFNPSTEISFKIQNDAKVKLTVFNSNGETVLSLVDGKMAKGLHKVNFDATKFNSGVYFYQLDVNGMKSTKKMVLAK